MIVNTDMIWYLAHPYKGDPVGNFEEANHMAATLIKHGVIVFSPVSHSHPIAKEGKMAHDDPMWYKFDHSFFQFCGGLIMSGNWYNSQGCHYEKNCFEAAGKPIIHFEDLFTFNDEGDYDLNEDVTFSTARWVLSRKEGEA